MTADTKVALTGDGAGPTQDGTATPWPLYGTAAFERVDPDWRASKLEWCESGLDQHVVRQWFPRCVDAEAGGFFCDFDARWRRRGPQRRSLEFQARQTRTAARMAVAFPRQQSWRDWALHGQTYLRDVMRDPVEGGWYWLVERDGAPSHGYTKHTHGMAYVLGSFALVYAATGSDEARKLGLEAFDWLEDHARDPVEGGYFGWMLRDGRPILKPSDNPDPSLWEPLGQGIGLKDLNVHSDLLQGLTWLYDQTSDSRVAARIAEVSDLIVYRFMTRTGALHYMLHPDWVPVPAPERYGYNFQVGVRLPQAAASLGRSVESALEIARLMVDHAIELGWHERRGGFIEAGPADAPFRLGEVSMRVEHRPWWVQADALQGLTALTLRGGPGAGRYRAVVDELVGIIDRDLIDKRYGGWREFADETRTPFQWLARGRPKGNQWKDASHETDAYLACIRSLRGLPQDAPLEG